MSKYVISFSKSGYIKYSSHLDMQRLFNRAFRRTGIELQYSQGYNPHPKISFAQPLSLGYSAKAELVEFETKREYEKSVLISELQKSMPEGISINSCGKLMEGSKSLASIIDNASYTVSMPVSIYAEDFDKTVADYLEQKEIIAKKRQKKTKKLIEVDIRDKIREISAGKDADNKLQLHILLDCGSVSNISVELVISTFIEFANLNCSRYEIEATRDNLGLPVDYSIDWM